MEIETLVFPRCLPCGAEDPVLFKKGSEFFGPEVGENMLSCNKCWNARLSGDRHHLLRGEGI